jgi:hypothetical protein
MAEQATSRIKAINNLVDFTLLTGLTIFKQEVPNKKRMKPPVFRDVRLSNVLRDTDINDFMSQFISNSMLYITKTTGVLVPTQFENDNHILNVCHKLLHCKVHFVDTSLIYFCVGICMRCTKLFEKTVSYLNMSQAYIDEKLIFASLQTESPLMVTRKVCQISKLFVLESMQYSFTA